MIFLDSYSRPFPSTSSELAFVWHGGQLFVNANQFPIPIYLRMSGNCHLSRGGGECACDTGSTRRGGKQSSSDRAGANCRFRLSIAVVEFLPNHSQQDPQYRRADRPQEQSQEAKGLDASQDGKQQH